MPKTLKPSPGRAIVLDAKTGKPKAASKVPRTMKIAKVNKMRRAEKAWGKARKP